MNGRTLRPVLLYPAILWALAPLMCGKLALAQDTGAWAYDAHSDASLQSVMGGSPSCTSGGCTGCSGCDDCGHSSACGPRLFGGAEYLLIRPHFSEAVGFATLTDAMGPAGFSRRVAANELDFDYESSFRLFLGYHLHECADVRLTYWHLDTDTTVEGTAAAGQTLVDPFGNLGPAGSSIDALASVQMNVLDFECLRPLEFKSAGIGFVYSAGLRYADVSQFYESTIVNPAGAVTSNGLFEVDFSGIGPILSLLGQTRHGACGQFSLFAKGAAALLVGQYDIATQVTLPGVSGEQTADRIRTVPVLESELGMAWRPNDCFTLSAGWEFQAWFNLGASGGTFDGEALPVAPVDTAFGGADDADIMSFDGLFLRAEIGY